MAVNVCDENVGFEVNVFFGGGGLEMTGEGGSDEEVLEIFIAFVC